MSPKFWNLEARTASADDRESRDPNSRGWRGSGTLAMDLRYRPRGNDVERGREEFQTFSNPAPSGRAASSYNWKLGGVLTEG